MTKSLGFITITKDPIIAQAAIENDVRVMVDIERIGKHERQGHKNTLISDHNISDLENLKKLFPHGEFILRVNPLYSDTETEINLGINAGAAHIMLPMFRKSKEVEKVSNFIAGRVNLIPLIETASALAQLDGVCSLNSIRQIHLGLNDLSIDMGLDFLFEVLEAGFVDLFCNRANKNGVIYGFGGVSTIGSGIVPAEKIIREHARLGSQRVILSRSFLKNISEKATDYSSLEENFRQAINDINRIYQEAGNLVDACKAD